MVAQLHNACFLTLVILSTVRASAESATAIEPEGLPREAREGVQDSESPGARDTGKEWFWGIAASNHHAKLQESEALIDQEINGLFSKICLHWNEPVTFKDWSDDWKIWDLWLLVGRDLGPKTTWSVSAGGAAAKIKNGGLFFPMGLPLEFDADFARAEAFVSGTVNWYPWGKPTRPGAHEESGSFLSRTLAGARPYAGMGTGYTYIHAHGDLHIGLPGGPCLYRKQNEEDYHLWQVSPRVGIEFPLNAQDSISVMGAYHFFTSHSDEFDSTAISLIYTHRLKSGSRGQESD